MQNILRKKIIGLWICTLMLSGYEFAISTAAAETKRSNQNETIVFFRHGEKVFPDNGNLNCQGLNRSLRLPSILKQKFGRPDYLFAQSPLAMAGPADAPKAFYYIRPLATIEPTAVYFNLPVNVKYIQDLRDEHTLIYDPNYENKKIFVAWEHTGIPEIVRAMGIKDVPEWPSDDFDSLYVVKLKDGKFQFIHDHEGLNGQPNICPFDTK